MFKRFWWVLLVVPPLGALLGLLVAGVVTYVMPKSYESSVTLEIRPSLIVEETAVEDAMASGMPDRMLNAEMERLKSDSVLAGVVESLELVDRWGIDEQTAIAALRNTVSVQTIKGTDLVSIQVRHTNRSDAKEIAGAVTDIYLRERAEEAGKASERNLQKLGGHESSGRVLVHEAPVIAEAPVTPNVVLNLVVGFVGGLFLGVPFALLLMGLLKRLS